MKSTKIIFISIVLLALLCPACEKNIESRYTQDIIGTWKVKYDPSEQGCYINDTWTFTSDGRFVEYWVCDNQSDVGDWAIEGDYLVLVYDEYPMELKYKIYTLTESEMTLNYEGDRTTFYKVK